MSKILFNLKCKSHGFESLQENSIWLSLHLRRNMIPRCWWRQSKEGSPVSTFQGSSVKSKNWHPRLSCGTGKESPAGAVPLSCWHHPVQDSRTEDLIMMCFSFLVSTQSPTCSHLRFLPPKLALIIPWKWTLSCPSMLCASVPVQCPFSRLLLLTMGFLVHPELCSSRKASQLVEVQESKNGPMTLKRGVTSSDECYMI